MDNHLRSSPLVPMDTAHAVPCTPQALRPHHEGPESTSLHVMLSNTHHRPGIEAEATNPHPIPRFSSFHHSQTSRWAVAVSPAATPAESVHAALNRDYVRRTYCHPRQTPFQLEITATSKDLEQGSWSCANSSVQQNYVITPNNTITTQIGKARVQERIKSLTNKLRRSTQPVLISYSSLPSTENQLERRNLAECHGPVFFRQIHGRGRHSPHQTIDWQ